jgi:hypothetical protein
VLTVAGWTLAGRARILASRVNAALLPLVLVPLLQNDIHNSFATVREALEFSAALRLPSSVTPAQRSAYVEEVMALLELKAIEHRQIGELGAANALAPGQRKILTIGVELCSNGEEERAHPGRTSGGAVLRRCWMGATVLSWPGRRSRRRLAYCGTIVHVSPARIALSILQRPSSSWTSRRAVRRAMSAPCRVSALAVTLSM